MVIECSMDNLERTQLVSAFNAINNYNLQPNALICSICHQWLSVPVFSTSVGVHICGMCNLEHEELASVPNMHLQHFIADKYFPCKHFADGCSTISLRKNLKQHEDECESRRLQPSWYCCMCDFRTNNATEMQPHYVTEHHVSTADMDTTSYTLKQDAEMQFVRFGVNTFVIRCVQHPNMAQYAIQVCEPFGMLPQFEYELKNRRYLYLSGQISTTWNQLKWPNNELFFDFDWRESLQIFLCSPCSSYGCRCKNYNGVECTYAFKTCCQLSLFSNEHFEHIMQVHKPSRCALIDRKLMKDAGTHYVHLDGNIFRVTIDAITLLYWFGGDYKYTYFVSCGKDELFLAVDEHKLHKNVQSLPENWKKIYVGRKD